MPSPKRVKKLPKKNSPKPSPRGKASARKSPRRSPMDHAADYPVNYRKVGEDGRTWKIVMITKQNGLKYKRWTRVN